MQSLFDVSSWRFFATFTLMTTKLAMTTLLTWKENSTCSWNKHVHSMNNSTSTKKKFKFYVQKKKRLKMYSQWNVKTQGRHLRTSCTELMKISLVITLQWGLKALVCNSSAATLRPRRPLLRRKLSAWLSASRSSRVRLAKTPTRKSESHNNS